MEGRNDLFKATQAGTGMGVDIPIDGNFQDMNIIKDSPMSAILELQFFLKDEKSYCNSWATEWQVPCPGPPSSLARNSSMSAGTESLVAPCKFFSTFLGLSPLGFHWLDRLGWDSSLAG